MHELTGYLLAIDPGPHTSGAVVWNLRERCLEHVYPEIPNGDLLTLYHNAAAVTNVAIEMIASYGMPVGAETFETCVWIGRFMEALGPSRVDLIYRREVKLFLCGNAGAKDAHIAQAIRDRFPATGGGAKPEVGTSKQPGPLYGVSKHAWAALGVALTWQARQTGWVHDPAGL